MTIPKETMRALYRDMLRTRRVELRIDALYLDDNMKTPIHTYIGQEAIAAGVCAHLKKNDPMFTTYRSHGQYLSKGGDLNAIIAELHCKATGCSGGYGGSMHVIDVAAGHYGSSAIVASTVPIATGMALAQKMKKTGAITTVFFGDGATDEGVFYESVNFAMLKQLPILYVLEDNGWAVCSPTTARHAGENVYHRVDPELMFTRTVDGNDVLAVYQVAHEAMEHIRATGRPALIECDTYRTRPHNGSGYDFKLGFREEAEVRAWEEKDPIPAFESVLIEFGAMSRDDMNALLAEIEAEVDDAFVYAESSPLPDTSKLLANVYRA